MATAILGTMLVMGMMASLIPGLMILKDQMGDYMQSQTDMAAHYAWCARNPEAQGRENIPCPRHEMPEGYDCRPLTTGDVLCVPNTVRGNVTARTAPEGARTLPELPPLEVIR